MLPLNQALISEIKNEAVKTRKLLERLPDDKFDWKPHEKSMTLGRLATHVAALHGFIPLMLTTDERDIAGGPVLPVLTDNNKELLELFDKSLEEAITALENASEDEFEKNWLFRRGEHVIFNMPKKAGIRFICISHMIHHRGQLSVFARLLDIPIPGMYGPSADER